MEFLSSFLERHFEGKPVVASWNVRCFLRLEFERLLPIFVDALKCIVLTFIFLREEPSKVSHIQRRRSRDKSTLNNTLILTANFVIQPDLSTKTPHKSKFTICFSAPLWLHPDDVTTWICLAENLLQLIRSTTHSWVVARHQGGNFALVSQMSFRGENSGDVAKFRLFSQAIQTPHKTALQNERTK